MKSINEYITESVASIKVNKMKQEFKQKFDNKVTIGSGRANHQQLYDVYIYDDKMNTLKEVNEILKRYLKKWKGFSYKELKDKLKEKGDFFKDYQDDDLCTLDRYPVEFLRFTSRDLL